MLDAMTSATPQPLSPHYYRDNFLRLCDSVERQYSDIFNAPERQFLLTFRQLPFDAQCLYVRLVSRTSPWFRESRLNYQEIEDISGALDALLHNGLIQCAQALDIDGAAKLFTLAELLSTFSEALARSDPSQPANPTATARKSTVLAQLETLDLSAQEIAAALRVCDPSRWVAPLGLEHVALLQLLFFGNRYQSLTDFILQDIGVVTYYPYAVSRDRRLFPHRAALEEHLLCLTLTDEYYQLLELDDTPALRELAGHVLEHDVVHPSTYSRWSKLCNRLARELERREAADLALSLYARSHQHPARERQARILEQQGDFSQALELCQQMLVRPWCEPEVDNAARITKRLQRKISGVSASRHRDAFPELHLQLHPNDHSVEFSVAQHLAPQWQSVRVVENRLMNTLFALAFWEQIFAPVAGAFSHPYQAVPHDMYSADFYERRSELIEQRIEALIHGELNEMLVAAFHRYHQYQCRWLHSRAIDAQLVADACSVIPATDLIAIWRRMLFDPRENKRGFPDLLALGEKPGDYCMIEVKAPGDRLQDHQKRWFRFFQRQAIPAQVAWVEWIERADG